MGFITFIIIVAIIEYGFRSRCPSCGSWFSAKHLGGRILHSFTDYRTVLRNDRDVQEAYTKHQIEHSFRCTKCGYEWDKITTDTSIRNPLLRSWILAIAIVLVILYFIVNVSGNHTSLNQQDNTNTEVTTETTNENNQNTTDDEQVTKSNTIETSNDSVTEKIKPKELTPEEKLAQITGENILENTIPDENNGAEPSVLIIPESEQSN